MRTGPEGMVSVPVSFTQDTASNMRVAEANALYRFFIMPLVLWFNCPVKVFVFEIFDSGTVAVTDDGLKLHIVPGSLRRMIFVLHFV